MIEPKVLIVVMIAAAIITSIFTSNDVMPLFVSASQLDYSKLNSDDKALFLMLNAVVGLFIIISSVVLYIEALKQRGL